MTKPLSPTQAQILTTAAQHLTRLTEAPPNLPAAARNAVFQAVLRAGLLEEVSGDKGAALRITEAGVAAVEASGGTEPAEQAIAELQEGREGQPAGTAGPRGQEPPAAPLVPEPRISLRDAATALLVAWDAGLERPALPTSIEALGAALGRGGAARPTRAPFASRTPREGTKQQAVLTLLRREEGATIAQVIAATGWAQHTVRGFLAGLKKKGHAVEVLERVRQVGLGAQGAKGSYSIYGISAEQG
ncbi:DUF3489 domain-containing protein [Roseomonas sp. WA12]